MLGGSGVQTLLQLAEECRCAGVVRAYKVRACHWYYCNWSLSLARPRPRGAEQVRCVEGHCVLRQLKTVFLNRLAETDDVRHR